ncbi:UDP-N-acetylmuramoylalanine--D-glutamate ligase [Sporobacter termitidis DSM 10068]|uniref:UDP-N-acetylmuramoylalanine--D-glutamate ligase n=1 Tax=Sporobacter termitidis DSM 10068 TaxID=1123282 RepID=A0A1M5UFJ7_9FIRM|nr:UDP-N-acetylmuramoyl-L-alanine--D-glutamate ligase [Sporobacter termitidis]SHH61804.1 UDP-N-acetylmuramoylalanine--D-glutamate ligase [Sporobacter termitidis DSM 10068]
MKLAEYIGAIKSKRIAVLGIGVSNTPLIELLLQSGCSVTACDKSAREKLGGTAEALEQKGAVLRLGVDYLKDLDADIIFRTPGLRPDLPELLDAVRRGAVLTSEMEVFFDVCPCRIIGVTGSDGKTTTTTIIAKLLAAEGYTVHLGGNIGTPLLTRADTMKESDIAVIELSSFQLMTMEKSPWVSVVTNLTPNHLDMHRDMTEYVEAKRNILRYQSRDDIAVLNLDYEIIRDFAASVKGEARFFSRMGRVENGVCLEGNTIYAVKDGKIEPVMDASEIFLPGVHNIENFMAAFAAVRGLVTYETCRRVAGEFGGVEHRCQLVRTLRGVRYYNDSIASSPTRTIAGLRAFDQKVILIAGGKDKGVPFDILGPEILARVKTLVLTGMTAEKIKAAVLNAPGYDGSLEIIEKADFTEAVLAASAAAKDGDVVFLSPASTSFDRFKNFEERGNTYIEIVNGLE